MPESATLDANSGYIFVSNVNEYAKDGNGFISRVSMDGTSVELRWLDGLDSPTGLAVFNGLLYFADFDNLIVADLATAEILGRYQAPDANPALNDVAISPEGKVFVSGSGSNSIYHLNDNELKTWKHDELLLAQANGLTIVGDYLVHGGKLWTVFNRHTAQLAVGASKPAPELERIDGITKDICGNYLITLIEDERLWRIAKDGSASPIEDGPINGIDIHSHADLLIVPQVGGHLSLYRQEHYGCAAL
ncbi:MAG: hypothetical protein DHS20C12_23590 [Pseudohongiella sp.]|nr:MAG: hypothetical protein DHS20C12_23590 [Pseudohongiella sp.]